MVICSHFSFTGGRRRFATLGRLLAASAKQDGATDELIERAEQMPLRAPMVITVVAKVQPHNKVPEFEQHLSAGCAVMAMQMAAQAQGLVVCGVPAH